MEAIWYLLAYGLGSISFAVIVSHHFHKTDIRTLGSFNPGATNTYNTLGKKAGLMVLLGDLLKGSIALLLPLYFQADVNLLYVGAFAVIGHCFPVWWGFRGGKAVATTAGVLLVYNPLLALFTYLGATLVVLLTKYVFMGSISIGIILFFYSLLLGEYELFFGIFIILLLFLHRSNIRNFKNGLEPRITKNKK
ncbi:glycerol-3-phosphate 1-O-acyltransferase PlsY [Metabacillus arenae]|uniref:Glycerol-3-phosphate acyltransferase n=1 Tax=Metabacillus arenae TaxID=2771434 RepID=A0A926RYX4_9BACI|nr:glycerol-3-phosphate 1-O-acyltransferase PlsY [Metabacillus arenae]MBD1382220.1 glycerol-3-phosphate 1-O-acyltransferase PlsY [Metabacillus arenae]